jgi:hypothetical protein
MPLPPEPGVAARRMSSRPSPTASGRMPYDDGSFDAAYLSSVLGEIPDRDETFP